MMRERGRVMEGQGEILSHNHKYLSCFHVLEVLISKHCKQLLIEETHILHFELCKIMSSTQFYISRDPVRVGLSSAARLLCLAVAVAMASKSKY